MITANRYHDISCGHRVVNHESKCANLHGHNYRFHFKVSPNNNLDSIGRVLDFSVIKSTLCEWLEKNWDHRMLIWDQDPIKDILRSADPTIVYVDFNPTAENIAKNFVEHVSPRLLEGLNCTLIELTM